MLYEPKLNQAMLAILQNRVAGIANCINALLQEGYVPNKNKYTIFNKKLRILMKLCVVIFYSSSETTSFSASFSCFANSSSLIVSSSPD